MCDSILWGSGEEVADRSHTFPVTWQVICLKPHFTHQENGSAGRGWNDISATRSLPYTPTTPSSISWPAWPSKLDLVDVMAIPPGRG